MKLHYVLPMMTCLLLSACGAIRLADTTTGVAISGVNYSDQPITYVVSDPDNRGGIGGEPVDPFGAGGTMCCFSLPNTWKPGIKVRVQIFDTNRKEVKDEILEVPPYVDGKPGRVWMVLYQGWNVDVLSSEYGPPHAKWPGRIKGWPVPNIEYRRKLWEQHLELKNDSLRAAQKLLKQLKENPEKELKESWEFNQKHRNKDIKLFAGHDDPRYRDYLLKDYEQFLNNAQQNVDEWMKRKP
jgi:hypothetical protein